MVIAQNQSDEELMEAYALGDSAAFNELYSRFSGKIYSYLGSKLFSKDDRDDVFQKTFLKLHNSRQNYSQTVPFGAWLFTICRSVFLDHLKAKRISASAVDISMIATDAGVDARLNVSESLAQINGEQRSALMMRFAEGLSFDEISERMNTSTSNVRQLISRALRKIRGESV